MSNELGLNGHNTFEGDVSLTRNDYFTAVEPGDDYKMNTTLFTMMMDVCKGNCSRETLSLYRAQRFNQSVAANPYMEFPPLSIALYSECSVGPLLDISTEFSQVPRLFSTNCSQPTARLALDTRLQ